MIKTEIKATEASSPYNTFDSVLEIPDGRSLTQNAWLTLQLRVRLNFVDSKNPLAGLTVSQGGKTFAKDSDGYLFPALDWPPHLIARFQKEYAERAEKTWNWQFVLTTPKNFSGLDYQCLVGPGVMVRPNVLCLFRMSVMTAGGTPLDTSPASGPMRAGPPHRTINVINLDYATSRVSLAPGIAPSPSLPPTRSFTQMDGLSSRSNALNYDDADLFRPAWWQRKHNVLSKHVGHEVGHALGQCHIMGLKGMAQYTFSGANANDTAAYGVGSADKFDAWNIMGGGDRIYLINAISWQQRIALHTQRPASDWGATGVMNTPTRTLPLGIATPGLAPAEW